MKHVFTAVSAFDCHYPKTHGPTWRGCMPYVMSVNEFLETHAIVAASPTTEKSKEGLKE